MSRASVRGSQVEGSSILWVNAGVANPATGEMLGVEPQDGIQHIHRVVYDGRGLLDVLSEGASRRKYVLVCGSALPGCSSVDARLWDPVASSVFEFLRREKLLRRQREIADPIGLALVAYEPYGGVSPADVIEMKLRAARLMELCRAPLNRVLGGPDSNQRLFIGDAESAELHQEVVSWASGLLGIRGGGLIAAKS
jgi:hypothetical protein